MEKIKEYKILITGGAGYIGSHTAKLMHKLGYELIIFDNLSRGYKELTKWGKFIHGDLSDKELLKDILVRYNVGAVIHFAAFAYVGESMNMPAVYYANNVGGTINLLFAMVEAKVNYIVFSSSCATYGNPNKIPIEECHPQNPINPYGNSKYMVERILADFDQAYGLKYTTLRYFNAAGADPEGEVGELHNPETHLIPNILRKLLGEIESLSIWGTDYETRDGTCIRDYVHVNDLAVGHIASLNMMFDEKKSFVFNLGTGTGHTVKEVIDVVEKITGEKVGFIEKPRRAGDPPILVADYGKAQRELGWSPKESKISNIVETAWNWHKNRKPKIPF